ncbi:MAG TPA: histone deacetylase [bacterium]|nr:histone deacetylase [bacterium]
MEPSSSPPHAVAAPHGAPAYWRYDQFALPLPTRHRYPRSRFQVVRERLEAEGALGPAQFRAAEPVPWSLLELVHGPHYLRDVRDGTLSPAAVREIGLPFSAALVERARAAVGATCAASWHALEAGAACVIGGGTHHAFVDRGAGYCLFSDIAVAIRDLQRRHAAHRVAIVDLDVHQGNGNAEIFQHDPNVFTFSVHGARNWPYRKSVGDLDLALPDGTEDAAYLAALEPPLRRLFEHFRPDLVFYLAGADPLHSDRLGRLSLTHPGLLARDRAVLQLCADHYVPVVVTMGGGYAVPQDDTVAVHVNTVRALQAIYGRGE